MKNGLIYKKPAFWAILLAGIAVVVAVVFLLTVPKEDRNEGWNDPAVTEVTTGATGTSETTGTTEAPGTSVTDGTDVLSAPLPTARVLIGGTEVNCWGELYFSQAKVNGNYYVADGYRIFAEKPDPDRVLPNLRTVPLDGALEIYENGGTAPVTDKKVSVYTRDGTKVRDMKAGELTAGALSAGEYLLEFYVKSVHEADEHCHTTYVFYVCVQVGA